jgi:hypothetical protein
MNLFCLIIYLRDAESFLIYFNFIFNKYYNNKYYNFNWHMDDILRMLYINLNNFRIVNVVRRLHIINIHSENISYPYNKNIV